MGIMKFFIRRRNNIFIKKAAFGSVLFMVSAFAVLMPESLSAAEKSKEKSHVEEAKTDSVFSARKVFEKIQIPALEILPVSTRLDMLDYWDVDSVYQASNAMEGLSWLVDVKPDFLKVRVSAVSTLEIKILPVKKGKIVMTVYTLGDDVQAQDSEVNFYDESLEQLPTDKYFVMPVLKDFFEIPKGSATKMKEIEDMIPFPTVAYSANSENDKLEARLTVEKFVNEDDWNIAKLFLKPYITLEWKKERYRYK